MLTGLTCIDPPHTPYYWKPGRSLARTGLVNSTYTGNLREGLPLLRANNRFIWERLGTLVTSCLD